MKKFVKCVLDACGIYANAVFGLVAILCMFNAKTIKHKIIMTITCIGMAASFYNILISWKDSLYEFIAHMVILIQKKKQKKEDEELRNHLKKVAGMIRMKNSDKKIYKVSE